MDRKRRGKKLSNEDWQSKSDPDARIAKMKNGILRWKGDDEAKHAF